MLAAEQGSLEIVQELIRRGANVNLDDVVSETDGGGGGKGAVLVL